MEDIIFVSESDAESSVGPLLKIKTKMKEGWKVKSITAQHVSTGGSYSSRGGFIIILEKTEFGL